MISNRAACEGPSETMTSESDPRDTSAGHPIFTRRRRAGPLPAAATDQTPAGAQGESSPPGGGEDASQSLSMPLVGRQEEDPDRSIWSPLSALEKAAPHAIALLCRVWCKPQAARAFRALILDGDGKVRRWPRDAWDELVMLRNLHQARFPRSSGARADAPLVDPTQFCAIEINYRHVAERLVRCWGNPEAFAVVYHDLVIDKRGNRAGWPAEVWDDLVLLQKIHDQAYGALPPGAEPWKDFFLVQS
jgi:hypothetical protein